MRRPSITTTTTHPQHTCHVCTHLAREANDTARRLGRDSWVSEDVRDGIRHVALYESQSGDPSLDTVMRAINQSGDPS